MKITKLTTAQVWAQVHTYKVRHGNFHSVRTYMISRKTSVFTSHPRRKQCVFRQECVPLPVVWAGYESRLMKIDKVKVCLFDVCFTEVLTHDLWKYFGTEAPGSLRSCLAGHLKWYLYWIELNWIELNPFRWSKRQFQCR